MLSSGGEVSKFRKKAAETKVYLAECLPDRH